MSRIGVCAENFYTDTALRGGCVHDTCTFRNKTKLGVRGLGQYDMFYGLDKVLVTASTLSPRARVDSQRSRLMPLSRSNAHSGANFSSR